MSAENVALVRRSLASVEDFWAMLDEHVVWDLRAFPGPDHRTVYVGRDVVIDASRRYWGAWADYSLDALELIDAGASVVGLVQERGRGKASGVPVDRRWAQVWTVRSGRIVRWELYPDPEAALEATAASSGRNREALLRAVDAASRQDADAFLATGSPDIEWEDSVFWSEGSRTYRGTAELREWFQQVVVEPWESIDCEIDELIELPGDRIFYGLAIRARGRESGAETELRVWSLNWFADGVVTRRRVFRERADAAEAAGLEE